MKNIEKMIIVNIVCNIFVVIVIGLLVIDYSNLKMNNISEKAESNIFNVVNDEESEKYVFLGDSITNGFKINDLYESSTTFINSGENGNKVENVMDRLQDSVYKYNPSKVFVLIGINDLNNEENDVDKLSDEIKSLINNIENNTNAEIYLESIYPVNNSEDIENNRTFNRNNKDVKAVNKKLEEYCKNDNNVTYIDVYDELVDENGSLKRKYTTDGLHLTTLGYVKVVKVLSKYL